MSRATRKRATEPELYLRWAKQLREDQEIGYAELSEGLCRGKQIQDWESGKWEPDWLTQELLIQRLGVGAEDYELYLEAEEYACWERRTAIIDEMMKSAFDQAEILLEQYRETMNEADRLERQFYLSLKAMLGRCAGLENREVVRYYTEALKMSVPKPDKKPLSEQILSYVELNLLLESGVLWAEDERERGYRELVDYIEKRSFDRQARAKIYPKAVWYLVGQMLIEQDGDLPAVDETALEEMAEYTRLAVETLRDSGRMYYLWELLDIRGRVLSEICSRRSGRESSWKMENFKREKDEVLEWKCILEELYSEYRIPRELQHDAYLFAVRGVYSLPETIRVRREMLGMTRQELCGGICDIKTLRRLEKGTVRTQRAIVRELFARLNLPPGKRQIRLRTADPKANELMSEVKRSGRDYSHREERRYLNELQRSVSMENWYNYQELTRKELWNRWQLKEISTETYIEEAKKLLELTIPYEVLFNETVPHLTRAEISLVHNLMTAISEDCELFWECAKKVERIYPIKRDVNYYAQNPAYYEFMWSKVESAHGNQGRYDRSDEISRFMIEKCLTYRRLESIERNIYNIWWNRSERAGGGSETLVLEKMLEKCISLATLAKVSHRALNYRKTLEKLRQRD